MPTKAVSTAASNSAIPPTTAIVVPAGPNALA